MHMKKSDTLTPDQIGKMRDEYILPSTMKYFPLNIVKGEMQFVYDDVAQARRDKRVAGPTEIGRIVNVAVTGRIHRAAAYFL